VYVGRFAPSPTGPLHFGSLLAALASYLDARAACGKWLLRIEDLDAPRVRTGAADAILRQLDELGMAWDGPIVYQSARLERYRAAFERLEKLGAVYPCACTRAEMADSALAIDGARIYPGTCRAGMPDEKTPRAWRLRTQGASIGFDDRVQGAQRQEIEREVGDFVLLRADGVFAYQLAVVVDDAEQGVTDVVRGADLIDSTARQMHLQRLLGYARPRYLHFPVAVDGKGEKLSKQTGAPPARREDLPRALAFLGQPESATVEDAVKRWNPAAIPAVCAAFSAPR
jgi:glutamyl-Q tRNA(Asp) synthetase